MTGMMTASADPSNADLMGDGGFDEITAEEMAALIRIRSRTKERQHTPYRKALLNRLDAVRRTKNPKSADAFPLPGGGYQTYRLAVARHKRLDQSDIDEARQQTAAARKIDPNATPISPPEHWYNPGDLITPETDAEALLIDQDPNKFRPVGPGNTSNEVDALQAELSRLRAGQQRQEDLDAREQQLAAQQAELEKLRADLAKQGKGKQ